MFCTTCQNNSDQLSRAHGHQLKQLGSPPPHLLDKLPLVFRERGGGKDASPATSGRGCLESPVHASENQWRHTLHNQRADSCRPRQRRPSRPSHRGSPGGLGGSCRQQRPSRAPSCGHPSAVRGELRVGPCPVPSPAGVHTGREPHPTAPSPAGRAGLGRPTGALLGEGVRWLPGPSRPRADADETAGDSTRGTAARPAVSRVGGTGPGFSGKAGGCCSKSESEARSDRASSASFSQRPGQHSTDVSARRGPQLTPDPGLMWAGLLQGGGFSVGARGGPGPAHQWYRGNLPCRVGPGEASTLLPHGQRAGPGPGAGGRWSLLVRTEAGPCELAPPLSTDPHLPSSPGGRWAGPGLKRTRRRAVGTHQHFDRHDPWFLVHVMKLETWWSATRVSSALTDRLHTALSATH